MKDYFPESLSQKCECAPYTRAHCTRHNMAALTGLTYSLACLLTRCNNENIKTHDNGVSDFLGKLTNCNKKLLDMFVTMSILDG